MSYHVDKLKKIDAAPYFTECLVKARIFKNNGKTIREDGNADVLVRFIHKDEEGNPKEYWGKVAVRPIDIVEVFENTPRIDVGDVVTNKYGEPLFVIAINHDNGCVGVKDMFGNVWDKKIEDLTLIFKASDVEKIGECVEGGGCPDFINCQCCECRYCESVMQQENNAESAYCHHLKQDTLSTNEACKHFRPL